jgi:phosphocarrier protein FPr
MARKVGQRTLVIRTFDFGGDKPFAYADRAPEANPFLGRRGLRLYGDHGALFKAQLRAILRASPGHNLKILIPMVSQVEDILQIRRTLSEVFKELDAKGTAFQENMELGIMIEVPAAAMMADRLARHADFFSIGTNDLSQYVMAADRTSASVGALADPMNPAVLRMIRDVARGAQQSGIEIGVCGELAGEPAAIPILIGLGLTELSMNPASIPSAKRVISHLSLAEARALAEDVMDLDSAEDVRKRAARLSTESSRR